LFPSFHGSPGMVLRAKICACLGQKFGEEMMARGKKIGIFSRGTLPAVRHSRQFGHCDGTGQAVGTHTGTGGQCALCR